MLKWAKPNQRRVSECSDASLETCSNLSTDSSESGITLPIRYHERHANRPKSLALAPTDILDLDEDHMFVSRKAAQRSSSNRRPSFNRANRHSMIVTSTRDLHDFHPNIDTFNNNNVLKISTTSCQEEATTGVLKITTDNSDKPKSRNTFWKNLRAKAQGKKSDKKQLAKSHSMSNIPDMTADSQKTPTNDTSDQVFESVTSSESSSANINLSPIMMKRQPKPLAEATSPSSTSKTRANVMRRRSFKLIKKQNENKKPKPFTKSTDFLASDIDYPPTGSPDSGISSIRHPSSSDYDSPESPITPINTDNQHITGLRQQFTDAVFIFLNDRIEKKGYDSIINRNSSTSSQSEDGAPDIFCYDTDTVARRPSHHLRKSRIQASH